MNLQKLDLINDEKRKEHPHDDGLLFESKLKKNGIRVELREVIKACHGYEQATRSNIVKGAMLRRLRWISVVNACDF